MGLDATEITIPTSPYGMYKVTLPVSVERLTAAVEKTLGIVWPLRFLSLNLNPECPTL